jgi:acetyl/propionyl-CoA carboxylase alpha subunit
MLVKVTANGRTWKGTILRLLLRTLREFRIRGVKTNISFLENVLQHEDFKNGKITVNFIGNNPQLTRVSEKSRPGHKNPAIPCQYNCERQRGCEISAAREDIFKRQAYLKQKFMAIHMEQTAAR